MLSTTMGTPIEDLRTVEPSAEVQERPGMRVESALRREPPHVLVDCLAMRSPSPLSSPFSPGSASRQRKVATKAGLKATQTNTVSWRTGSG